MAAAERLYRQGAPDGSTRGRQYKASFTNFTSGKSHSFGGEYLELVPHERLRWTDKLDDLPGEMTVTVRLKKVSVGTEINIVQAGLPDAIPPDACTLGWQESLALLAKLVEAEESRTNNTIPRTTLHTLRSLLNGGLLCTGSQTAMTRQWNAAAIVGDPGRTSG